jgi:hypothetical protein
MIAKKLMDWVHQGPPFKENGTHLQRIFVERLHSLVFKKEIVSESSRCKYYADFLKQRRKKKI